MRGISPVAPLLVPYVWGSYPALYIHMHMPVNDRKQAFQTVRTSIRNGHCPGFSPELCTAVTPGQ